MAFVHLLAADVTETVNATRWNLFQLWTLRAPRSTQITFITKAIYFSEITIQNTLQAVYVNEFRIILLEAKLQEACKYLAKFTKEFERKDLKDHGWDVFVNFRGNLVERNVLSPDVFSSFLYMKRTDSSLNLKRCKVVLRNC